MTAEPSENGYRRVHVAELREALTNAWTKLREALPAEARAIEQYESGKSQDEIASEERVRRQTVNRRIARARVFMQEQLADFRPYQSA